MKTMEFYKKLSREICEYKPYHLDYPCNEWVNNLPNQDIATKSTITMWLRSIMSCTCSLLMLRINIWEAGKQNFEMTIEWSKKCTFIYFKWIQVHQIVLFLDNKVFFVCVVQAKFICIDMQTKRQCCTRLVVVQIITMINVWTIKIWCKIVQTEKKNWIPPTTHEIEENHQNITNLKRKYMSTMDD